MSSWFRFIGSRPTPDVQSQQQEGGIGPLTDGSDRVCCEHFGTFSVDGTWHPAADSPALALQSPPQVIRGRVQPQGTVTVAELTVDQFARRLQLKDGEAAAVTELSSKHAARSVQDRHAYQSQVASEVAKALAAQQSALPTESKKLRIVVISDTHEFHDKIVLPPGDILIHAGDILQIDRFNPSFLSNYNVSHFFDWFNKQPFPVRIVIGGNHDAQMAKLGKRKMQQLAAPAIWAEEDLIDVLGVRIFATPRSMPNTKKSGNEAYQEKARWQSVGLPAEALKITFAKSPDEEEAALGLAAAARTGRKQSSNIFIQRTAVPRSQLADPDRLDVLVTHCAPVPGMVNDYIQAMNPTLHIGGHVHEWHGVTLNAVSRAGPKPKRRGGILAAVAKAVSNDDRVDVSASIPTINGAMMRGSYFKESLFRPLVFDYETVA